MGWGIVSRLDFPSIILSLYHLCGWHAAPEPQYTSPSEPVPIRQPPRLMPVVQLLELSDLQILQVAGHFPLCIVIIFCLLFLLQTASDLVGEE